nr:MULTISPECIES: serine protease [unclassified Sphingomonas]
MSHQTIGLPPATAPELRLLTRDGEFKGALLGLWSTKPEGGVVQGTAFLVAPGLALTAAHVIDEYIDQHGLADGKSSLMAVGTNDGEIVAWVVDEVVKAENSDVAILSMTLYAQPTDHLVIAHFQIGTRLPVAGEFVRLLGTHSPTAGGRITVSEERDRVGRVELATVLSSGPVLEAMPHGRGFMLPNPGFVADLTVLGGMSGGPVFDQTGRVIGLLTAGHFNAEAPADKYALVSLFWASLWADFNCSWPPKFYPQPSKLLDVIEPYEAARVQPDGQGRLAYHDFAMNDPLPGAPPA